MSVVQYTTCNFVQFTAASPLGYNTLAAFTIFTAASAAFFFKGYQSKSWLAGQLQELVDGNHASWVALFAFRLGNVLGCPGAVVCK
jgi:hypothetical protein